MSALFSPLELADIYVEAEALLDELQGRDRYQELMDSQIVRCVCGMPCWLYVCHNHKHCLWCGREMRHNTWPRNNDRSDVIYGGRGYCMTHYMTVNKYGEEALEAELNAAVEAYWRNRKFVLAGIEVPVDHS